jgi:hypothetical protein
MRKLGIVTALAMLPLSSLAFAQSGAVTGGAAGAATGAVVGGPVGAAVGGVAGAVAGGIADKDRPRFKEWVVKEHKPSYSYKEDVRVGATLPSSGITYYEVPREYGVTKYRYTVVNDRAVLVDPGSHKIVEVIE